MTAFLVVLHVLVCAFLILFVLLQPGARGGVGGSAFGGAGGQTVFGGRGANTFLAKLTGAAAVVFMITSISLSYFGSSSKSIMAKRATPAADVKADKKEEPKADAPAAPTPDETNESGAKPAGDAPPAPSTP